MFKSILLPLDLTDRHQPAVDIAADLARHGGAEVTLLHVIEVIPGLTMDEERDFYGRLQQSAEKHLGRLGRRFEERQIAWRSVVRYGARAQEVARYAGEMGADLIVVTAPRMGPDHPAVGWGSLSWKVGILSPCPVLLVKG